MSIPVEPQATNVTLRLPKRHMAELSYVRRAYCHVEHVRILPAAKSARSHASTHSRNITEPGTRIAWHFKTPLAGIIMDHIHSYETCEQDCTLNKAWSMYLPNISDGIVWGLSILSLLASQELECKRGGDTGRGRRATAPHGVISRLVRSTQVPANQLPSLRAITSCHVFPVSARYLRFSAPLRFPLSAVLPEG